MTTPAAHLTEQPAALLFPGDLVWFVRPSDDLDWTCDEYAEASVLLATDAETNSGLIAWFDHDFSIVREWWVRGEQLEPRSIEEGIFTFDRIIAQAAVA